MKNKDHRLAAFAWAAHEMGLTYGQFMTAATPQELEEACERYEIWFAAKRKAEREKEKAWSSQEALELRRAQGELHRAEFGYSSIHKQSKSEKVAAARDKVAKLMDKPQRKGIKSWWDTLTPEERAEHSRKVKAGQAAARAKGAKFGRAEKKGR